MKIRDLKVAALLFSLLPLTEGCTHRGLNENAPTTIADNVEIIFNWSKIPAKEAKTMMLYLYPEGHAMMDYGFKNPEGGIIRTYAGSHTAVCHSNDDPYGHRLRNHQTHDGLEIYTDDTAVLLGQGISTRGIPRATGTEEEPLRNTPSMIYGTHDREIDLKITTHSQKIELYPEELICRYTVEFLEVENIQSSDLRIDATISSLAGGYYPGRQSPTSEAVSHTFSLNADIEKKTLTSEFFTFGVPAGEEKSHMLCLYIAMKDKTGNFYTFDVTDVINQAPDPRNVTIRIYGLKLPEIQISHHNPEEGGMIIDVNTWETTYFDLRV